MSEVRLIETAKATVPLGAQTATFAVRRPAHAATEFGRLPASGGAGGCTAAAAAVTRFHVVISQSLGGETLSSLCQALCCIRSVDVAIAPSTKLLSS